MKKNDLFYYFRGISNEDIKEFKKFLMSPYFVTDKSLLKIFNEIIHNRVLLLDNNYEKLITKIAKKLKYSKPTIVKQLSYLSKAILKFLMIKSFDADITNSNLTLNNYLLNNKLLSILKDNLSNTDSLLAYESKITDNKYLQLFQNDVINFTSLIHFSGYFSKNNHLKSFKLLESAFGNLILYTVQQAAGIYINYVFLNINIEDSSSEKKGIEINNLLLDLLKKKMFDGNDEGCQVFRIYYNMFQTFYKINDKSYFLKYKKCVESNIKILNKELIKFHYQALINFCSLKERRGEENRFYKRMNIELLFEYFNNNYFSLESNEFVNAVEFSNFIERAYSIGEYDKIKLFVEENSSKLSPEDYSDMVKYGCAYYYLGKNDYRKALKYINDISKNNNIINYNIRNIEIRIYYELKKYETLRDALHNYNNTVTNDSMLTRSDKIGLQKLIVYLNNLLQINNNNDIKSKVLEAEYNRNNIEKENTFALKDWIKLKYDEILYKYAKKKKSSSSN